MDRRKVPARRRGRGIGLRRKVPVSRRAPENRSGRGVIVSRQAARGIWFRRRNMRVSRCLGAVERFRRPDMEVSRPGAMERFRRLDMKAGRRDMEVNRPEAVERFHRLDMAVSRRAPGIRFRREAAISRRHGMEARRLRRVAHITGRSR